jgi:hypothetical protein
MGECERSHSRDQKTFSSMGKFTKCPSARIGRLFKEGGQVKISPSGIYI